MKKLKILAVLLVIVTLTNVHAALQSRPGVAALKRVRATDFFKLFRDMEMEGGSLGLTATLARNSSTRAYEETSESNNIDSHMCKNTEWGTVAMLSASDYGVGELAYGYDRTNYIYNVTASTTGNMTGVFGMYGGAADGEYMAAGILNKMYSEYNQYLINAAPRYVDSYEDSTDYKDFSRYIPGDATYETQTFYKASSESKESIFVSSTLAGALFKRGTLSVFYSGGSSIFGRWW